MAGGLTLMEKRIIDDFVHLAKHKPEAFGIAASKGAGPQPLARAMLEMLKLLTEEKAQHNETQKAVLAVLQKHADLMRTDR